MAGIFGEFFLVSVSHETKREKSSKNSGKIRSKIRDENSRKIREVFVLQLSWPKKKGRTSPGRETPPFETPPFGGPWEQRYQKPERGYIRQNHPFTKLPLFPSGFLKRALAQTCFRVWYQVRFLRRIFGHSWAGQFQVQVCLVSERAISWQVHLTLVLKAFGSLILRMDKP